MNYIRSATRSDANQINSLLLEEYRGVSHFDKINSRKLYWRETNAHELVLAAWDEAGRCLSTMRGEIVRNRTEAENSMECAVCLGDSAFPALVLGKGATSQHVRNIGLNSALRYYFLSFIRDTSMQSVLGGVYDGAPRVNLMKSLGYEFYEPEQVWTSLQSSARLLVGVLKRSEIIKATAMLRSTARKTLCEYPWRGDVPKLIL